MTRCRFTLLLAASAAALGQSPAQPEPEPLIVGKAGLMNTIKAAALKEGDLFFLRTIGPWQQGDCTLPTNTTITGQVTASKSEPHRTTLVMRFTPVPCAGSRTALMTPLLVALQVPTDADRSELEHFGTAPPPSHILAGVLPASAGQGRPDIPNNNNNALTSAYMGSVLNKLRQPVAVAQKSLKTGEVRGMRGVAMDLPGREQGTTTLSSSHGIVLERDTQFALAYVPVQSGPAVEPAAPSSSSEPVALPNLNAAASASADRAPPDPEDIEDVCSSSDCKQLAAAPDSASAQALWTVPLAALGYQARPQQQIMGLDDTASIHFVGDDQLLLTFTLHSLRSRPTGPESWASNPRNVRAVLISRVDGRILTVKDWTVPDDLGPFVWSAGNGRVLAHVGHELIAFGPGLKPQQRVPLAGPLLFLAAAPHGDLLVVATVHERHTEQQHAQISAFIGPGRPVDEDYELTGFDASLHPTGTKRFSVEPIRPALLQDVMVSARLLHGTQWLVEKSTWDGQASPLARVHSACPVEVQSLAGDLLLVQGCVPSEASVAWYRVLSAKGATLLKGTPAYGEFLQQAESDQKGDLLAIASSHFDRPIDRHSHLRSGDFTNLNVAVYDTRLGKQVFVARVPEGSAQQDTFSLSPSGSSLAVLTSVSLQAFSLLPPATSK